MDTTVADNWYIDNYIDELPWSEGGRTYAPQDVMEEIPEQMGDYLNPSSVFESSTKDKVMEKTTRKNRGREKLLGWHATQSCAARTIWWADVGTREEQSAYWGFKELDTFEFDLGFRICNDPTCGSEPIASGDAPEPISYTLATWHEGLVIPLEEIKGAMSLVSSMSLLVSATIFF